MIAGVVLGGQGVGVSGAAAGSTSTGTLPPEGLFESCPLASRLQSCEQRLQAMAAGGFQVVVMPAGSGSLDSLSAYAAQAQQLGMSVMWELSDPTWWRDPPTSTNASADFQAFAAACGCKENGPLLTYMVRWLAALPATYGYYAADDSMLGPSDSTGVESYVTQIKQLDSTRTVMIGASGSQQQNTYGGMADLLGAENYPLTTTSLMPASANQAAWSAIGQWASQTQQAADAAGKQSAFILQAFTWGDNLADGEAVGVCSSGDSQQSCYDKLTYPTSGDQLQLRNEVLLNAHPQLILWYSFPGTYGQAGDDTYTTYPSGQTATDRWGGLTEAIEAPYPTPQTEAGPITTSTTTTSTTTTATTTNTSSSSSTTTTSPQSPPGDPPPIMPQGAVTIAATRAPRGPGDARPHARHHRPRHHARAHRRHRRRVR